MFNESILLLLLQTEEYQEQDTVMSKNKPISIEYFDEATIKFEKKISVEQIVVFIVTCVRNFILYVFMILASQKLHSEYIGKNIAKLHISWQMGLNF